MEPRIRRCITSGRDSRYSLAPMLRDGIRLAYGCCPECMQTVAIEEGRVVEHTYTQKGGQS